MQKQYYVIIEFDYNELKSHYCSYHDEDTFEHWYERACQSPEHLKQALDNYNCLYNTAWRSK